MSVRSFTGISNLKDTVEGSSNSAPIMASKRDLTDGEKVSNPAMSEVSDPESIAIFSDIARTRTSDYSKFSTYPLYHEFTLLNELTKSGNTKVAEIAKKCIQALSARVQLEKSRKSIEREGRLSNPYSAHNQRIQNQYWEFRDVLLRTLGFSGEDLRKMQIFILNISDDTKLEVQDLIDMITKPDKPPMTADEMHRKFLRFVMEEIITYSKPHADARNTIFDLLFIKLQEYKNGTLLFIPWAEDDKHILDKSETLFTHTCKVIIRQNQSCLLKVFLKGLKFKINYQHLLKLVIKDDGNEKMLQEVINSIMEKDDIKDKEELIRTTFELCIQYNRMDLLDYMLSKYKSDSIINLIIGYGFGGIEYEYCAENCVRQEFSCRVLSVLLKYLPQDVSKEDLFEKTKAMFGKEPDRIIFDAHYDFALHNPYGKPSIPTLSWWEWFVSFFKSK